LAFLLYDPPPALWFGAPVFIHSDKNLRLLARFRGGHFVAGHKGTVDKEERITERERIWTSYRVGTLDPPAKPDFDGFWEGQNGVRGLFLMDEVRAVPDAIGFKFYGLALEWGFPRGVGYRYLSLGQCLVLLRMAALPREANEVYLRPLLGMGRVAGG
jgi:hypothetical protein